MYAVAPAVYAKSFSVFIKL